MPPSQFDLFIPHKALFAPHAVRQAVASDQYPPPHEGAVRRLQRWQLLLDDEELRDKLNEESYKAEFLGDIFTFLLGYRSVGSAPIYNMRREVSGPEDIRPADAVLGFLGELDLEVVRVVVEVKPPGTRLDARQASRRDRLSPVDQGFLYAKEFDDVRWIIVTNFDEIRLYSHRRGGTAYESFAASRLVGGELHRFMFLLRRDNLLGDGEAPSRTEQLAEETWREQAQISARFYEQYQDARLALFEELRQQNAGVPALEILRSTQTVLDRLLFILFCKSRGLLPHAVLSQLRRLAEVESVYYRPDTIWQSLLSLFGAVNTGNPPAGIDGYNGGLFAPGLIDRLRLEDTARSPRFVLAGMLAWDDIDFESQIDVDILGHIFENSISDLERLERELVAQPGAVRLHWRNRQGIFYTPDWVTEYIVRHTVDRYLDENPQVGSDFKVLDPACGSGAFLIQVLPVLRERLRQVAPVEAAQLEAALVAREHTVDLFTDPVVAEPLALYAALRRCVYGVDKSPESVEITKLSFWLKTVVKGRPLPQLDANIFVGNSLVDSPRVAPDAFDWQSRVPQLTGQTHVIIGNPPWGADVGAYAAGLHGFNLATGQYDIAFLFVEKALGLLADGGVLGFVLPDSILVNEDQEDVRRLLAERHTLLEVIKLGEGVFPGVFRGAVILVVKKAPPSAEHTFRGLVILKADRRDITDVAAVVDLDVLMVQRGNTIANARIIASPRCEFTINVGLEDKALMDRIEANTIRWDEIIERGRGIELNSEAHVIQCPNCFRWDPPPLMRKGVYLDKSCSHCGQGYQIEAALAQDRLVKDGPAAGPTEAPYVDGTDVNRYAIERVRSIDISKDGINYKEGSLYRSPKILFRQTGVGTTATIDYDLNAYVPQSTYILRLSDLTRYRLEYILGVINSRLLLYHFLRKTGQVEWQSFPRWTMGRVFQIPVRAIDWHDDRQVALHDGITDCVHRLIEAGGTANSDLDLQIERMVMDLYDVSAVERQRVWQTLKAVQGVRTVSGLVPASFERVRNSAA